MKQLMALLAKEFEATTEQLYREWDTLAEEHPFREIVSLEKRSKLRHGLLDAETCRSVMEMVNHKANKGLRPHLEHNKKDSMVATTVVWDGWQPRVSWRRLFDELLPSSFFLDLQFLFKTVTDNCQATDIVDLGGVFTPRRITVNIYPAGKHCGLVEHWDRHAIVGVTTILLTPVSEEDVEDDMFLNEEYVSFPDAEGWQCGGLRRGSGICLLVGTTHTVRPRIRTQSRVTLNVVF